jgi:hypothetical protein
MRRALAPASLPEPPVALQLRAHALVTFKHGSGLTPTMIDLVRIAVRLLAPSPRHPPPRGSASASPCAWPCACRLASLLYESTPPTPFCSAVVHLCCASRVGCSARSWSDSVTGACATRPYGD